MTKTKNLALAFGDFDVNEAEKALRDENRQAATSAKRAEASVTPAKLADVPSRVALRREASPLDVAPALHVAELDCATFGGTRFNDSEAIAELCKLRPQHLPKLEAITVALRFAGQRIVFTTSRTGYAHSVTRKLAAFLGGEMITLCHAAQNERVYTTQLATYAARKRSDATWRLTQAEALGGLARAIEGTWTLGRALEHFGATIDFYEVGK